MFTERLELKQTKYPLDDQPDWLNDTRNTEFSELRHTTHDKRSCHDYIQQCSMFWGIQEVNTGEWIGTISAHIDQNNEIADLGILIHHEYTGKGYGREAWAAVCGLLLNRPHKLRKIEAGMMATNIAMRKLCEQTGFFCEGERKNHFISKEGHPVGLVMFGKWAEKR